MRGGEASERAGRPDQFTSRMKVAICAGDEAAPDSSKTPPLSVAQDEVGSLPLRFRISRMCAWPSGITSVCLAMSFVE